MEVNFQDKVNVKPLGPDHKSELRAEDINIMKTAINSHHTGISGLVQSVFFINKILECDDSNLDEIQEIVAYIKQNKDDLQNLSISNIAGLPAALNKFIAGRNISFDTTTNPTKTVINSVVIEPEAGENISIDKSNPLKPVVNSEVRVGGRNYLLNSEKPTYNNNYVLSTYYLSEKIKEGEEFVLTIWGELGSDREDFGVHNSGSFIYLGRPKKIKEGIYSLTAKWRIDYTHDDIDYIEPPKPWIQIHQYLEEGSSFSRINRIKLTKGNVFEDWSVSPEDFQRQNTSNTLHTSTNIAISDLLQGMSQNERRTVLRNGSNDLVVDIDTASDFFGTYFKKGPGSVIFLTTKGIPIIEINDTFVMNGKKGSYATVVVDEEEALLTITNIS